MRQSPLQLAAIVLLAAVIACHPPVGDTESGDRRPNFLIILTDDMGFTDLGAFGGHDIATPNLDRLAMEGVRFASFHGHVSCAPSRATLLTGTGNHEAGFGTQLDIESFRGEEGYERYLVDRVATLPEILRSGGYRTYISGKWGLGGPGGIGPTQRGFDQSFVLMPGGGGHYQAIMHESRYRKNGKVVPEDDGTTFSTTLFTDAMIDFLRADTRNDAPFFALFAPTAPHWPLHFPPGGGASTGVYNEGYEVLRRRRQKGALDTGVLPVDPGPNEFVSRADPWHLLSEQEKELQVRIMEIYAAMTAHLDSQVGRLLQALEETGERRNTLIVFINDNGAQGGSVFGGPRSYSKGRQFDNRLENLGAGNSWVNMGQGWAEAVTAPFRGNKASVYEGGIRVAAFANWQHLANPGSVYTHYLNNMDVMPTMLELAGVRHPAPEFGGREILPMRGRSFVAVLQGNTVPVHDPDEAIVLSSAGRHFVQRGQWKMARELESDWELYDLTVDPYERMNVAEEHPEVLHLLLGAFNDAAARSNILDR